MNLTPLRAIRQKCLWCCLNSASEVRLCPVVGCPSYRYRFGRYPEQGERRALRAIRLKCLDCCAYSRAMVKRCSTAECALREYRKGKNPRLRGKRGKSRDPPYDGAILGQTAVFDSIIQGDPR